MNSDPGFYGLLASGLAVAAAWVVGEGGKVVVAGGMGGLARWMTASRRRVRDGVISVVVGMIVGTYLWPAVLWLPGVLPGVDRIEETPNTIATAAFVAGALGMSAMKIAITMIEARFGGGGDEE